ncbi:MAG: hypothetical protein ABSH33_05230 [Steroidobacteraceae bacterium]|jgi:hypothetical protein
MTESPNQDDLDGAGIGKPPAESVYTYATAGIGERKGHVPIWLWLVVISLTIWGIYYLYTYWNPPAPP